VVEHCVSTGVLLDGLSARPEGFEPVWFLPTPRFRDPTRDPLHLV